MSKAKSTLTVLFSSAILFGLWYTAVVKDFLHWEKRALVVEGSQFESERSVLATAIDVSKYLLGMHPLQDRDRERWPGENDTRSDARNGFVALLLLSAVVLFIVSTCRGIRIGLMIVAVLDLFCGLVHLLVLAVGVIVAVTQPGPLRYDFHLYSRVLYCVVLAVPAFLCVRTSIGLTTGESSAWKAAVWSSVALVVINAPLLPIWSVPGLLRGFVGIFIPVILALANLLALAAMVTMRNVRGVDESDS